MFFSVTRGWEAMNSYHLQVNRGVTWMILPPEKSLYMLWSHALWEHDSYNLQQLMSRASEESSCLIRCMLQAITFYTRAPFVCLERKSHCGYEVVSLQSSLSSSSSTASNIWAISSISQLLLMYLGRKSHCGCEVLSLWLSLGSFSCNGNALNGISEQ